jgi:hypothetical protein
MEIVKKRARFYSLLAPLAKSALRGAFCVPMKSALSKKKFPLFSTFQPSTYSLFPHM